MVALAQQKSAQALSEGCAEIVQGDVGALPWDENQFTCAAGVEMLYFVDDPVQALRELYCTSSNRLLYKVSTFSLQ
jgi:ubiquinone/menaquinone biosynthesis C-methylase UbiE